MAMRIAASESQLVNWQLHIDIESHPKAQPLSLEPLEQAAVAFRCACACQGLDAPALAGSSGVAVPGCLAYCNCIGALRLGTRTTARVTASSGKRSPT